MLCPCICKRLVPSFNFCYSFCLCCRCSLCDSNTPSTTAAAVAAAAVIAAAASEVGEVGGENISSIEVENILYRHPAVIEAAVVARNDEKWGETPCAFITLKPGANDVAADDIIAFCRDNMAHYKCPRHVVFGPLPKTSTGKIQKFVLREQAKEV